MRNYLSRFLKPAFMAVMFLIGVNGWGQATLPVATTTMGKSALPTGFTHSGLGTDYAGPHLKFDTQGDYLVLNFSGTPGTLSFELGVNNTFPGTIPSTATFSVEESADGSSYTNVASYTNVGGGVKSVTTLNSATRYIRWNYTTKPTGTNIAFRNVNLAAATSATAPTVTTDATPSVITSTSATFGGNVTATGGASINGNGFVYSLTATNSTPAISGTGVTQVSNASPGTGTGTFSVSTSASLNVNSQYSYRAYATNSVGTSYGGVSGTTFYTLAATPSAPTVNNATSSSLDVAITSGDGNPSNTEYAIYETTQSRFVQSDGTLGVSAIWQAASSWGTITVTGLSSSTSHTFQVKARNGASTETSYGSSTSLSTSSSGCTAQTINFDPIADVTYGDADFDLNADASSSLTVAYSSSNTSVATVSGSTITIVGPGSTTITASQAGDVTYCAATPVDQTLTVNTKELTVSSAAASNKTYNGTNAATITGNLVGIVGSDVVTLTGTGTFASVNVANGISVTSTSTLGGADAAKYTLSQPTGLTANITKANQSITLAATDSKIVTDADYTLAASSATSGVNALSYSSSNTAVATINSTTGLVEIIGVGTTDFTVTQGASSNYNAATPAVQTLTVTNAPAIFAIQDFEDSPATPTWSYSATGGGTNATTDRFNGAKSYRLESSNVLTMANIDITGYTSVVLNVAFAATGVDNGDDLFMDISYDDGSTWAGAGTIQLVDGYSNSSININSTNAYSVGYNPYPTNISSSETQIRVRFRTAGIGAGEYYFIDDVKLTGIAPIVPTISTISNFTSFSTTAGSASASQSYTVSGDYLTDDVTITAPANFEVSTNNTSFSSSVVLNQTGGNLDGEPVTVYARITSGASAGSVSGNISHASTDATTVNIAVDGEVISVEPTNQPTSFVATAGSYNQVTVTWSDNDGAQAASGFLIMANTTGTFTNPVDGVAQADETNLNDNVAVVNVGHGVQTYTWNNNVSGNTTYYFKIFPYNGSSNTINYKTDGTVATANTTTPSGAEFTVGTLSDFGSQCLGGTYGPNSFNISGAQLSTADVSVSALSGFTFSTTAGGTYTSSLTLSQSGGSYNQDIYVKFSPVAIQSYNGDITISGGGANSVTVAAAGTGINTTATVTTTTPATNIDISSATCSGNVTDAGCQAVTERGVCYSTSSNPTTADSKVTASGTTGAFNCNLTGLTSNTTYHFRAYVITSAGTSYGNDASFSTSVFTAPVADAGTDVSYTSFTANWNAAANATGYKLDVYTQTSSPATDLFISEYVEGSSNNKYIEIYNGTGASVDLSDYYLRLFTNGASVGGSGYINNQLSGTLANNSVIVYKNGSATTYSGTSTTNTAVAFNGDDAVALYKNSTSSYVDIIGRIGNDPGTAWTSTSNSTLDKTLVRNSSVTGGITTSPTGTGASAFTTLESEWIQFNQDDVSNLGSHTFSGGSTPTYEIQDFSVSGLSYSVTGLDSGVTYYYTVRGSNGSQASSNSNIITVSTKPKPANGINIIAGSNTATISWTRGNGDGVLVKVSNDAFTLSSQPTDGTDYSSSCNTTYSGTGEQWVYDGTGTSVVVNLPGGFDINTLNVALFEYSSYNDGGGAKADVKVYNQGKVESYGGVEGNLPIELIYFSAKRSGNEVAIDWSTATELNNDFFTIERGLDAKSFAEVGRVQGAGSSNRVVNYNFIDYTYDEAILYYRLKQTDFDGKFTYSNTIAIGNATSTGLSLDNIYSAGNGNINMLISSDLNRVVNIQIINSLGQIVESKNVELASGTSEYNLQLPVLSKGVYMVRINQNNNIVSKRIVF